MNWIIEQDWNHVLFLHWKVDADLICDHVPFELDLFEGKAVISIVPFQMNHIRFPFTPRIPFVSSLWELNLRTYVKVDGVSGVYFFTLDTDSAIGSFIANRFFHLPYRLAKMEGAVNHTHYSFFSERDCYRFQMDADVSNEPKEKTKLDRWATDREHLFTKAKGITYRGTVIHSDWKLLQVTSIKFEDRFSSQLPIKLSPTPDAIAYCAHLKVRFRPFEKT